MCKYDIEASIQLFYQCKRADTNTKTVLKICNQFINISNDKIV